MKNTIRISNLEEYISEVFKDYSKTKPNSFFDDKRVFFRGQNKSDYDLTPSLGRKIGKSNNLFSEFEYDMINTAKLQNPEEFTVDSYPVNMLARMQHYGLPTRLLDITENSLIAIYFACNGLYDYDGTVFVFEQDGINVHSAYSMYANLIAAQSSFTDMSITDVRKFWDVVKHESFIPKNQSLKDFFDIHEKLIDAISKPIFVLPEMSTEREKRQLAAFILYPNELIDESFNNHLEISGNLYSKKYIINHKSKRKILKQLKLLGISEEFIFPELDKKCVAIKESIENRGTNY